MEMSRSSSSSSHGSGGVIVEACGGDVGRSGGLLLVVVLVGGGGVVAGVGGRPVALELWVLLHEVGCHLGLAGVRQRVLNRALQLHAPVLEPVPDLERKKEKNEY